LQPLAAFDEQKENTGAEAEQHDGNAGGDAPEGSGGRGIVAWWWCQGRVAEKNRP
jgi:hypothetical protein